MVEACHLKSRDCDKDRLNQSDGIHVVFRIPHLDLSTFPEFDPMAHNRVPCPDSPFFEVLNSHKYC
jgi:hypothetical protein